MSKWIIKQDVPILDEHVLKDQDGKEVVRIDASRLRDIAGKATRRVEDTGDLVPIVIGHTTDDGPEDTQPEIVGYAGPPFKVVPFRKTGRKVLTATFRFFKHMRDKVARYPRRSVELWLSDWKIDPIALLGATTPERDLGLLQLGRGGRKFYRRVLGGESVIGDYEDGPEEREGHEDTSGPDDELVQKVIAALEQTDCWQFLEQLKQEAEAEPEVPEGMPGMPGAEGPMGEPGMPPLPPEGGPGGPEYPGEEEVEDEDQPVKYENSMPGGTNTSTPGGTRRASPKPAKAPRVGPGPRPVQHSREAVQRAYQKARQEARPAYPAHQPRVEDDYLDYPDPAQERVRLVRDQTQGQLARYQRALQAQQGQIQDLRLRYQRAEREKDLIQLESEGVVLDRAEELALVEVMPEAHYRRHLGQIRKRYQRAPVGGPSYSQEDLRAGNGLAGRSRDQAQQAVALAQRKGISYEEALAQLTGDPVF